MNVRSLSTAVFAGVVAGVLLTGCAGYAPATPRYQAAIPPGSTLVLEQALDVAPGRRKVYLQDGRVVQPGIVSGATRFRPLCWFTVEAADPATSEIRPDRFETGEVRRRVRAGLAPGAVITVAGASLDGLRLADGDDRGGGGPDYLTHELEIPLSSERQPRVQRLSCRVDYRADLPREMGLYAVEQALAGVARVEPPE